MYRYIYKLIAVYMKYDFTHIKHFSLHILTGVVLWGFELTFVYYILAFSEYDVAESIHKEKQWCINIHNHIQTTFVWKSFILK